jgi:hypothetical protein
MSSQKKPRTETDASDGPLDYVEEDEGHHDARVDVCEARSRRQALCQSFVKVSFLLSRGHASISLTSYPLFYLTVFRVYSEDSGCH